MISSRTMSRAIVIAAVVSVGSSFGSEMAKKCVNAAGSNVGTIMGIGLATTVPDDCDAAKAAIETTGVLLDQVLTPTLKDDKIVLEPGVLAVNFFANVAARKGLKCLNANGVKVPTPQVGGFAGSHVVSPACTILKAAAPQIIASFAVAGAKHAGLV